MANITFHLQQAPTGIIPRNKKVAVYIVVSQNVTTFTQASVQITGATIEAFTGSNAVYKIEFTTPASGSGTITITIPENVLSGENHNNSQTVLQVVFAPRRITTESISFALPFDNADIGGFAHSQDYVHVVDKRRRLVYAFPIDGGREVARERTVLPDILSPFNDSSNGLAIVAGHVVFSETQSNQDDIHIRFAKIGGGSSDFEDLIVKGQRIYDLDVFENNIYIAVRRNDRTNHIIVQHIRGEASSEISLPDPMTEIGIAVNKDGIYLSDNNSSSLRHFGFDGKEFSDNSLLIIPANTGLDFARDMFYVGRKGIGSVFEIELLPINFDLPESAPIPIANLTLATPVMLNKFFFNTNAVVFAENFDKPDNLSISQDGQLFLENEQDMPQRMVVPIVLINQNGIKNAYFRLVMGETLATDAPIWRTSDTIVLFEGESEDMFKHVSNALTITANDLPGYMTLENGIMSIADQAVDQDTEVSVNILITNPNGNQTITQNFLVLNSPADIEKVSHSDYPIAWEIFINGEDFGDRINVIRELRHTIDNVKANVFQPAHAVFALENDDNIFDLSNNNNYFVQNNLNPSDGTVQVVINTGFELADKKIMRRVFSGTLSRVSNNDPNIATFTCADRSRYIRDTEMVDFGERKDGILLESPEESYQGIYPIPRGLQPVSDRSLAGFSGAQDLNIVEDGSLRTEGDLDPINVKPSSDVLFSEGRTLDIDPQISFKSSYRNRTISDIINAILSHYDINKSRINVSDNDNIIPYFRTKGRVSLRTEDGDMRGYIKSWIADDNGKVYKLIGHPSVLVNDRLILHDVESDRYTSLYKWGVSDNAWDMASSDFDTFYLLTAQAYPDGVQPSLGRYDPSQIESSRSLSPRIQKITVSNGVLEDFISNRDALRPTMANYYQVGIKGRQDVISEYHSVIPDNRSGFFIHNGFLYYRWANNGMFGVARKSLSSGDAEAVHTINGERYNNQRCFSFTISANILYVGYVENPLPLEAAVTVAKYNIENSPRFIDKYITNTYFATNQNDVLPIGVNELLVTPDGIHAVIQFHNIVKDEE